MRRILLRCIEFFKHYGREWDKLSPTKKEAIEFAHKNINPEPPVKVSENKYSWQYYLAHYGDSIVNPHFRRDDLDKDDKEVIAGINEITTNCDMVLYRGVHDEIWEKMRKNAKNIPGIDLIEKSVMQTCLVKGCEIKTNHRLRIFVPKGTHAVYLGNVNKEQYWYEVDIQCGANLKIVSMDETYINCVLISTK